jgi:hypothetical protein
MCSARIIRHWKGFEGEWIDLLDIDAGVLEALYAV